MVVVQRRYWGCNEIGMSHIDQYSPNTVGLSI